MEPRARAKGRDFRRHHRRHDIRRCAPGLRRGEAWRHCVLLTPREPLFQRTKIGNEVRPVRRVFQPCVGILFPGTTFCGDSRYASRIFASHTMSDFFIASL
jgi:hypothetical protein